MPRVAMNFRYFADYAEQRLGHPDFEIRGHRERITYDPAGVAAIITPWNAPLMLATWRIGPALAAGNTVVLKPPEWAPLTASLLADITAEAGLPAGVFNVVQGTGREAGAPLTAHPGVNRLALHRLGPDGGRHRRRRRRRTSCRCPSSSAASRRCWSSTTPTSTSPSTSPSSSSTTPGRSASARSASSCRTSIAEEFTERVVAKAPHDRPGRPPRRGHRHQRAWSPGRTSSASTASSSGPLADGARAILGGGPNDDLGGLYFRPTILVDATPGSEILTEEVFGPVLTLQTFAAEDEGVAMANDTRFGLAATLVTGDRERAERVSARCAPAPCG